MVMGDGTSRMHGFGWIIGCLIFINKGQTLNNSVHGK